jgi:putative tryptophan/tyrosine transport system substrate-binding protein
LRRIGVLMNTTPDEPDSQARITALAQGLQEAGWAIGRNLRIDTRWSSGNRARLRKDAADLVALGPDVIVAGVGPTTLVLQQVSHTVPIVMAQAGAAGRQCHRLHAIRIWFEREMAGTA